jgi:hypothetical protein
LRDRPEKNIHSGPAGVLRRLLINLNAHRPFLSLDDHVIVSRGEKSVTGFDRLTRCAFFNLDVGPRL